MEIAHGRFIDGGRAFEILSPPPAPWSNILANGSYGAIWTERGGAFAWGPSATFDRLTRWDMDLVLNPTRRSVFLVADGELIRSLTPAPNPGSAQWRTIHAIGSTSYIGTCDRCETRLDVMVLPDLSAEIWYASVTFRNQPARKVRFVSFQDVMLGNWAEVHHEFHRLFVETRHANGALLFTKHLDTRPSKGKDHWNTPFPGALVHMASATPSGYETDRAAFYGYAGDPARPAAVLAPSRSGSTGRWGDPMASLDVEIPVAANAAACAFVTAFGASPDAALETARSAAGIAPAAALEQVQTFWDGQLQPCEVTTPSDDVNHALPWLRYQAITARLFGRTGLYQCSGAFGYRDQLQDSMLFLPYRPDRTQAQLELHEAHQFADGSAYHWWHPGLETGSTAKYSDDYLWTVLTAADLYRETGDASFLDKQIPYVDAGPAPIWDHLRRAIDRAWAWRSERGLPRLGDGDWNDGLSSAGDEGRGESVWMGHFLHKLLHDMALLADARQEDASGFTQKADEIRRVVNEHGWDGEWYMQGTTDSGALIGSAKCAEGSIHLNPQTWSVIGGTASGPWAGRAAKAMDAVKRRLVVDWGVLLLAPGYRTPDPGIGYLTRYAPGRRENGGVYTHAAVWTARAARMHGDRELCRRVANSLLPPTRGRDPRYIAEPYVTPGNIDGPDTPTPGKAGWTWYTGSAAWLHRIVLEDLLGIRAEPEGLLIDPAVSAEWKGFSVTRPFRGALLRIQAERSETCGISLRSAKGTRDISGNILPASELEAGGEYEVRAAYRAL